MAQEMAQTIFVVGRVRYICIYRYIKIDIILYQLALYQLISMASSLATIGVPTASRISTEQQNKTTLEMLMNLQKLVDEFKVKATEMDQEMDTIKLENTLLRNKIKELTTKSGSEHVSSPQRRGVFGYGADEF